jgi:hypothetical protein
MRRKWPLVLHKLFARRCLHGIVPGLFIVQEAPFRRPLGTFHQQLCHQRDIVTAKQNIESYLLFMFPKSTLMVLLRSSAPLSQLVFSNEQRFCYKTGRIICNMTGMVASL